MAGLVKTTFLPWNDVRLPSSHLPVRSLSSYQSKSPGALSSVHNDFPVQPWDIVQIDTLELSQARQYPHHCVLVVVDMFSKWAEAVPLMRHDAASVAQAFMSICLH